jgi:hypothetical protein
MKKLNFNWFSSLLITLILYPLLPTNAQCTPSLGSASNFAIFTSFGAISNAGTSIIEGDIGTNQGVVSGFETSTISGTTNIANAATQEAATDIGIAYAGFLNMTPTIITHTPAFGNGETIFSGVYSISGAGSIANSLTLDAQNNPSAKFILKFSGAFTSGANSTIILSNGAQSNNIYWIVDGAFSLAANTTLKGTVIVNGAISIGTNNNLNCKLFSISNAISLYGTSLYITGINNSSTLYYADVDQDGYGNPAVASCIMETGYVLNHTDCIDSNAQVHPNAVEIYGNGIDDNCNGIIDTDTSICGNTTTWNGNTWSNGIPSYEKSAIFFTNFTSTSDIYACSILVTNNATVTFNNSLFVYNNIIIDSNSFLIMNNNNNLIQINPLATNTGNINISRNTSTIVRLDHTLWSSPVSGQNLYNFSPATLTYRFYTYDTPTDTYLSSTLSNISEFSVAKGYAIRAPNNQSSTTPAEWTGSFRGIPNNGHYPFNLLHTTSNKYNLLGNPYPSTIDALTFVNENVGTIEGTLYFYEHTLTMDVNGIFPTGTNYASWNATGGTAATSVAINSLNYHTPAVIPNGSIQVGQGFFVVAKNSGVVNFDNSQRINNQDHQFLKTTSENQHIWLNITTSEGKDINQILIGYIYGATMGADENYDGKSYGNIGNYLYSIIENEKFVIQGRALPFNSNDEVPLGWYCETAGNYSIKLSNWDGTILENQDIFIRDNLTGTTNNIKLAPYNFTSTTGTFYNRFTLVYLTNLNSPSQNLSTNTILVYKIDSEFLITSKEKLMDSVSVFDLTGRLLHQIKNINTKILNVGEISKIKQVLIFKIIYQDQQCINVKAVN